MQKLHRAQSATLYILRHSTSARFSELRKAAGLESDIFKFHIQTLQKLGYVSKLPDGAYELTPAGREFANNLDDDQRTVQKQPKLSMLLFVTRQNDAGETEYLVQERLRHPFFGYVSCLSGPLQWGEAVEVTAGRELAKQTGLSAAFVIRGQYRQRDYSAVGGTLLEDKLFVVMEASAIHGTLQNTWPHGKNSWMTLAAIQRLPKRFDSFLGALAMLQAGQSAAVADTHYLPKDY